MGAVSERMPSLGELDFSSYSLPNEQPSIFDAGLLELLVCFSAHFTGISDYD
jgi:hypothetical protein